MSYEEKLQTLRTTRCCSEGRAHRAPNYMMSSINGVNSRFTTSTFTNYTCMHVCTIASFTTSKFSIPCMCWETLLKALMHTRPEINIIRLSGECTSTCHCDNNRNILETKWSSWPVFQTLTHLNVLEYTHSFSFSYLTCIESPFHSTPFNCFSSLLLSCKDETKLRRTKWKTAFSKNRSLLYPEWGTYQCYQRSIQWIGWVLQQGHKCLMHIQDPRERTLSRGDRIRF